MKNLIQKLTEVSLPSKTVYSYQKEPIRFDHDVKVVMISFHQTFSYTAAGVNDGLRDGENYHRSGDEGYSIWQLTPEIMAVLKSEGIDIPKTPDKPLWLVNAEKYQDSIKGYPDDFGTVYEYTNRWGSKVSLPSEFKTTELFRTIFGD